VAWRSYRSGGAKKAIRTDPVETAFTGFMAAARACGGGLSLLLVLVTSIILSERLVRGHCQFRHVRPVPQPDLREIAMAMDAREIERLIKMRIPDAEVTIRDLAGDGDHYAATVLAESFRGKSRVQQHQIVYEALKAEMGGKLHALALQTGTPER
jgi:stress-induced morphogen